MTHIAGTCSVTRLKPKCGLIVKPALQQLHPPAIDEIHEAVGLSNAARPYAWTEILERLRFAGAAERLPPNLLHEFQHSRRRPRVCGDPELEVV